jgi:hypothetical protein
MPAAPKPDLRLSLGQARRVFAAAQGFPAQLGRNPVAVLEENGFVRTLGGVDVYLAVRARVPGMRREDLDGVVGRQEAQIVPAVRGCMYLVARRDVPLALRVADLLSRSRGEHEQAKAGIRPGEVEEVGKAVLETLRQQGPLTTDALRKALPAGTVRSLGEPGKKVGLSSALPPALRVLEFAGKVERILAGVRLDSERYLWRVPAHSPFAGARLPDDPIDLYAGMARIFLHATGLGTLKDFAGWTGISQRDAKAALERTGAVPVEIEGAGVHHLLEDRKGLLDTVADTGIALLSFEDNLMHLHGGPVLLVDEAHHATPVSSWGMGRSTTLGEAKHLSLRAILVDGKIAGFWEYDPDAREVVSRTFDKISDATRSKLDEATADIARFLTDELGHGRSFSLDTDDDLRKRAALVRRAGA